MLTLVILCAIVGAHHAAFLTVDSLLGAGRRHRHAVHARDRRHLRHHAGRHRPVDPVDGLAGQRDRGADPDRARLCRLRRSRSPSAPLAGLARRPRPCQAAIPSFIATLAVGGVLAGTALVISEARVDHDGRGASAPTWPGSPARASGIPHEVVIGADRAGRRAFLQSRTRVRPLQRRRSAPARPRPTPPASRSTGRRSSPAPVRRASPASPA